MRIPLKNNKKTDPLRGLPARIRLFRKLSGLTLQDVAAVLGVSYQQVQKYETGSNQLPLSAIPILCDLLGVTMDQLLYGGVLDDSGAPENRDVFRMLDAFGRTRQKRMREKMADIIEILAD